MNVRERWQRYLTGCDRSSTRTMLFIGCANQVYVRDSHPTRCSFWMLSLQTALLRLRSCGNAWKPLVRHHPNCGMIADTGDWTNTRNGAALEACV